MTTYVPLARTMNRTMLIPAAFAFVAGCNNSDITVDVPTVAPLTAGSIAFEGLGHGRFLVGVGIGAGATSSEHYLIDADARTLTGVQIPGHDASLSPDGTFIAFRAASSASTKTDLFVSRVDGSQITQLTAFPGEDEGPPSWSPDGASVLFTAGFATSSYHPAVYRVSRLGGTSRVLLSLAATQRGQSLECPDYSSFVYTYPGFYNSSVSFSPSGDFVFSCYPGAVYVANETGAARLLYGMPDSTSTANIALPTFSPGGTQIAFLEGVNPAGPGSHTLRIVDAQSGSVTATVPLASAAYALCWSRDGSRLAFVMYDSPAISNVFAVASTGGTPQRVTTLTQPQAGIADLSCSR